MFAGPNGAGKSSIYEASNKEYPQVNADVIQKENPDYSQGRAGIEAGRRIEELLKEKASFSTENNFYKNSNLNTVTRYQNAGYRVEVTYVSLQSAELCKERVASRVANGGHPISDKQVDERFIGGLETIKNNYHVPDKVTLLDNTGPDREQNRKPLLTIEQGKIVQEAPDLPKWAADIKNHIQQMEQEAKALTPQQQFKESASSVAAGLRETGQASDALAAARLQEVSKFVDRVPHIAGLNKENVEKALVAADKVPALAGSPQVAQLRSATSVLEQPGQERAATVEAQRTVPTATREAATPAIAASAAPTRTHDEAREAFINAAKPVAQALRENGEGLAAARLQEVSKFVDRVPHISGINKEGVDKAITAADKIPSLKDSKELGELKSSASVLEKQPTQERGAGQSATTPSRDRGGEIER